MYVSDMCTIVSNNNDNIYCLHFFISSTFYNNRIFRKFQMSRKFNLKSRIISALRRIFFYSPLRREALLRAKVEKDKYKSALSNKLFSIRDICVDHVAPVVDPIRGWTTWDDFINRLFCSVDKLQVISKKEHKKKSKKELKTRKRHSK